MSSPRKTQGGGINPRLPVAIGIDPSYSGFAMTVLDSEGGYATHLYTLPGDGTQRLVNCQHIVNDFVDSRGAGSLSAIAIEGYAQGSKFGREIAGELRAAVALGLWQNGHKTLHVVAPTVVKKLATGKGNATKDLVLLHTYKRWGVEFDDNNMADSYCVARWAHKECFGT